MHMTLTPAKKQQLYRERQKAEEVKASLALADVFRTPFFEFLGDFCHDSDYNMALELTGIAPPQFDDDRGPEHYTLDTGLNPTTNLFAPAVGSLGRAEVMVSCLTTAAKDLAWQINRYKQAEIKARLAEIEASDLSDPETKKAALKNVTRLNKMLDQLDKQIRLTFPQWKVSG